jgi:hypothetical protein
MSKIQEFDENGEPQEVLEYFLRAIWDHYLELGFHYGFTNLEGAIEDAFMNLSDQVLKEMEVCDKWEPRVKSKN